MNGYITRAMKTRLGGRSNIETVTGTPWWMRTAVNGLKNPVMFFRYPQYMILEDDLPDPAEYFMNAFEI